MCSPWSRMPSWISCAERQQVCAPRYADDRCVVPRPGAGLPRAGPSRRMVDPRRRRLGRHGIDDSRSQQRARLHVPKMARIVLICAVLAAAATGCGGGSGDGATIVAAFYPLAFVAQEIVGEGTPVRNLTPAGAEPHDLELTAADVRAVRRAAAVVYVGGGFMPGLEAGDRGRDGRAIDVLDGLDAAPRAELVPSIPHVWLDPRRLADIARRRRAGCSAGPSRATSCPGACSSSTASSSAGSATASGARSSRATPPSRYLADRYGLEQVPLEGLAPEAEPAPRDARCARRAGARDGRHDGVHRAARLAAARRDGRPRGRRADGRARSARGPHARAARSAVPTTSRSCGRTSAALREALGCR